MTTTSTSSRAGGRRLRQKAIAGASLTVAVGTASMLLLGAGAAAATTQARSPLPGCVSWTLNDRGYTDHLTVTNNCGEGHWFKVILAHKPDYPCQYFAAGASRWYSWPWPGRFDGLHNC